MAYGDMGFYNIKNNLVINEETAKQLHKLLQHQYISYDDYPEVHKLMKQIVEKFPECLEK